MPQSYVNLLYHLVFSTKERQPLITEAYQPRLYEYLGGTIRGLGGVALEINGVEDHVHVLAKLRQDKAVSEVLRDLKANASGWLHAVFPELQQFAWQNGYGAFTVSTSQVAAVRRYIANQKAHHQQQSFEEEFVQLLKLHDVEYDERYLWK
ncbi:MAG: IS200/IS605 family transposase [Acidobacteria bacterium]|nr:IS200/IS605 family transposase [Acidobacteriota bacterium]MBI3426475.1 IS200/IS605 family transposase [Acidobacteriota bacterium]